MNTRICLDASTVVTTGQERHRVNILRNVAAFESFRTPWQHLQDHSEDCSPSLDFQYCKLAATQALSEGSLVAIVMVYDDEALVALWPLTIRRTGFLRAAGVLTSGNNEEYGGPLFRGRATPAMCAASIDAVMQLPADILEIPFVEKDSTWGRALQTAPQSWVQTMLPERLHILPGYAASLRDFARWEDFVGSISPSLRRNLRRYREKLNAAGNVEFGWCTNFDDATSVLHWLFSNKRQWARERGLKTGYLMKDRVRDFFITLAKETALDSVPLVTFVKVNGVPVCASVNLIGPRTVEYWIFTYDEAYSRYSVGNLLTEFVARWAHENGRDFDMRPLYNAYKISWTTRHTRHWTPMLILTRRGRLAELTVLFRLVSRVRRRVARAVVSTFRATRLRCASLSRSRSR